MFPTYQRVRARLLLLLVLALCPAAGAAVAAADSTLVVRGAGEGHGVGLSQQGALGFAQHGYDYRAILAHYFTGTALGHASPRHAVRVLLQANQARLTVSGARRVNSRALRSAVTYTATLAGRRVVLRTHGHRVAHAPVLRVGGGRLRLGGKALNGLSSGRYRGVLELRAAVHGGLNAIDLIAVDDYVRGVLASEVPAGWPAAALQAQAVASRSYALTSHAGSASHFDLYADTRSQLYRGANSESATTDSAVRATAGQVLTYAGQPVTTYFFSSSGGQTENSENSFAGTPPRPWLRGVSDPFDGGPLHRWGPVRLSFAQAGARLSGLVRGSLVGIEVTRRGVSPRVVDAQVLGSEGATAVSGPDLAARLGLPDAWDYFSVDDGSGERPEPDTSAAAPSPSPFQALPAPSGGTAGG